MYYSNRKFDRYLMKCPLSGQCALFRMSTNRGSTVVYFVAQVKLIRYAGVLKRVSRCFFFVSGAHTHGSVCAVCVIAGMVCCVTS